MRDRKQYMREYNKKCRLLHKEKLDERSRKFREDNPEYVKEYNKRYREEHWHEIYEKRKNDDEYKMYARKYQKTYRAEHKDELLKAHKEYYELHKDEMSLKHKERNKTKWYVSVHNRTALLIRKKWIRPKICPICWNTGIIEAHHPDYSKRNEIVFCCQSCHHDIHNWYIKGIQTINILDYNI